MSAESIAFLHLGQMHDDFPDVVAALGRLGVMGDPVLLDDTAVVDWSRYAAVNLRECRGYHLDGNFLERLEDLYRRVAPLPFVNPLAVARSALDKSAYLPALGARGVELVPTYWPASVGDVGLLFEETGWDELVVKPVVSSKSWNTFLLRRTRAGVAVQSPGPPAPPRQFTMAECQQVLDAALAGRACCVQRFIPEVETRGETAFVFLGGALSHAVRKTVAAGGWLAHEFYGGTNAVYVPDSVEIAWAEDVYRHLVEQLGALHYARIDALPESGRLLLLECELIVPRLFLREAGALDHYAQVLATAVAPR